jgi:molybdate transport system regulatory protein
MPKWRALPRIRVVSDERIALGPGKADLLEAIARHGSIRDAASDLGMSYMRAWNLIRTMNDSFREPVVIAERGGSRRGGAELTETGRAALRIYRKMEKDGARAMRASWRALQRLLKV